MVARWEVRNSLTPPRTRGARPSISLDMEQLAKPSILALSRPASLIGAAELHLNSHCGLRASYGMLRKLQGGMTLGRLSDPPILSGASTPVLAHLALKGGARLSSDDQMQAFRGTSDS